MTFEQINKIKKMIADKAGTDVSEIEEGTFFEDDLNIGEMDLMDLVEAIEDTFSIELSEEVQNLETVGDLIDQISEQLD